MEIIEHLSVNIGERPSGTAAEERAAAYLASRFQGLGLQVETQEFRFLGWRAKCQPSLHLHSPVEEEMTTGWVAYTGSTPPGGAAGVLRRAGTEYSIPGLQEWPRYAVTDQSARHMAYVLGNTDGPALPFPNPNPVFTTPMVVVSSVDNARISAWLDEGREIRVTVRSEGEYVPDLVGRNVIATLPGRSDETVIACAHFDSVPGSPGAVDNASGVQVIFDIARDLAGRQFDKTIKFVCFGAEEDMLVGSRHYVREAKSRGELGAVKAVINFDTVAIGTRLVLRTGPEHFRHEVDAVLSKSGARELFDLEFTPPWASSDHHPFWTEGIPVVMLVLHPWDLYHRPTDNISVVDRAVLASITALGTALVKHAAG